MAPDVSGAVLALSLQPGTEELVTLPPSPFSDGDFLVFAAFVVIVAAVFGFDMLRTWWETNQWKRDARRRRKEMR
jgi:hypothetical protein